MVYTEEKMITSTAVLVTIRDYYGRTRKIHRLLGQHTQRGAVAQVGKGKLLGCLAHAPAREAFFVLHSGFAAAALASLALQVHLKLTVVSGPTTKRKPP